MNAEKFQNLIFYRYRYFVAYVTMVTVSLGALVWRLDELLPGISESETQQGLSLTQDSTTILEQGVFLPYNLLQTLTTGLMGESALSLRIPSVFLGVAILVMMFSLIHMWHREKIAIASILFLATSSWFLTFARLGTPYIFIAFSVVSIFLVGTLIRHGARIV